MNCSADRKGIVFLVAVILLGITVLICSGLTVLLLRDVYTIRRFKHSNQAYFLAEAGIERAIQSLYDSNFDTSPFPMADIPLGEGRYTVTLDTSKHSSQDLVLAVSTGTVKGVSKTIKVLLRDNSLEAFNYPVLCGGRMWVAGGSGIYGGDVRSNNSNRNWAVLVGGLIATGYVDEDVYACGEIKKTWLGEINGDEYPYSSAIEMPPFDADFFNYYKELAQNGGIYYSGAHTFTSGTYSPGNGVIFVRGKAVVNGNVTLNGCLIATGRILVNPNFHDYSFTQNQIANLPALMTSGGDIGIYSPSTINGLVYSSNRVLTFSLPLGIIDIDGAVIGKGGVYLYATTRMDFVRQNPPGIPTSDFPLQVICWSN